MAVTQLGSLDVSAASGLVVRDGELWVVADDERTLLRCDLAGRRLGTVALPGEPLPAARKARKKVKPDYESLCALPDGALLALGSGSRERRCQGAWVAADGATVRVIDLAALYAALPFARVNIEGAALRGGELVLAQRLSGASALVFLDFGVVARELAAGRLGPASLGRVVPVTVGERAGVPLSLTDLAVDEQGVLHFSAAAEPTDDPYDDAPCVGSVVGRFDADLRPTLIAELAAPLKVEGLALDAPRRRWLMVADADDPAVPSPLLALDPAT
jgi:hypothetical protein